MLAAAAATVAALRCLLARCSAKEKKKKNQSFLLHPLVVIFQFRMKSHTEVSERSIWMVWSNGSKSEIASSDAARQTNAVHEKIRKGAGLSRPMYGRTSRHVNSPKM